MDLNVSVPGGIEKYSVFNKGEYINRPFLRPFVEEELKMSDLEADKVYIGATKNCPPDRAWDVRVATKGDDSISISQFCRRPKETRTSIVKSQDMKISDNVKTKITSVVRLDTERGATSIQELAKDGTYSVERISDNGINVSYKVKPQNRKFAQKGIAAKLEKFALKIGTDADGFERPVLRRIAGWVFDSAQVIKRYI